MTEELKAWQRQAEEASIYEQVDFAEKDPPLEDWSFLKTLADNPAIIQQLRRIRERALQESALETAKCGE